MLFHWLTLINQALWPYSLYYQIMFDSGHYNLPRGLSEHLVVYAALKWLAPTDPKHRKPKGS